MTRYIYEHISKYVSFLTMVHMLRKAIFPAPGNIPQYSQIFSFGSDPAFGTEQVGIETLGVVWPSGVEYLRKKELEWNFESRCVSREYSRSRRIFPNILKYSRIFPFGKYRRMTDRTESCRVLYSPGTGLTTTAIPLGFSVFMDTKNNIPQASENILDLGISENILDEKKSGIRTNRLISHRTHPLAVSKFRLLCFSDACPARNLVHIISEILSCSNLISGGLNTNLVRPEDWIGC